MQGGKEQILRRIRHTPQGDVNTANAAGNILMVDQGVYCMVVHAPGYVV